MLPNNRDYLSQLDEAINNRDYKYVLLLSKEIKNEDHVAWVNTQFYLGWMYEFGLAVEQSNEAAERFYMDAASHGDYRAQFRLGSMSARSGNFEKAVFWFQQAADQEYAPAMWRLGIYYNIGRCVPKNISTAKAFFVRAMNLGHCPAMRSYGLILLKNFNPLGFYFILKTVFIGFYLVGFQPTSCRIIVD